MSRILIIANLNCDQILRLNRPISSGARIHFEDMGRRIGGGATNTGLGLRWAGHEVELLTQTGEDELGDWLISEAERLGLNCDRVRRHPGTTQPLKLLMEPDGERTILRPRRPNLELPESIDWRGIDALYVNTSTDLLPELMEQALDHCLVVAQVPRDQSQRPCHYLIGSADDLTQHNVTKPWQWAKAIAGDTLKAFVITKGEQGGEVYFSDSAITFNTFPAKLVDSTGAGDCFSAGLIHGLLSEDFSSALTHAARWSAFAVEAKSSIPPEALKAFIARSNN